MRINKYLALNTDLSRRKADEAVFNKRVKINGHIAVIGESVEANDTVLLDEIQIHGNLNERTVIMLNKPVGYVCSRFGQGSKTVYDLLPKEYRNLKTAGRLDKNSSGLLLLTNDGTLLNELTHPKYMKNKIYEVSINRPLNTNDEKRINLGVELEDGISKMQLNSLGNNRLSWQVTLQEGRNRQIRRTFLQLGYDVIKLHRSIFGEYHLNDLSIGNYIVID